MISIGTRLELFVDHFLIENLDGVRLALHHPQPAGVAFAFDKPWEGPHSYYSTVIQDGDRYRFYYRGMPGERKGFKGGLRDGTEEQFVCMAESPDGIHWSKPNLGLYEAFGSRDNNIVYAYDRPFPTNFSPFIDTNPAARPEERYKAVAGLGENMLVFRKGQLPKERSGIFTFASPDGIHWKRTSEKCVFTDGSRCFDSQNVAFWSQLERCYLLYYRQHVDERTNQTVRDDVHYYPYHVKTIARATSKDFVHWSEGQMMDLGEPPTRRDTHFYVSQTHPYFRAPHIYIATPKRLNEGHSALTLEQVTPILQELEDHGLQGFDYLGTGEQRFHKDCSDVMLLTSRGGLKYDRTFRDAFIRPGIGLRHWGSRSNLAARGVVQTGPAEMSLYVHRHYGMWTHHLERFTLRLDGFASVNAPYDGGELLTKPFQFGGKELVINYATSGAGSVRVEVRDEDNGAIPGFTLDDCPEIIGDEIERVVRWKNGSDVSKLAGQNVRLRFVMTDADLYSIRFRG